MVGVARVPRTYEQLLAAAVEVLSAAAPVGVHTLLERYRLRRADQRAGAAFRRQILSQRR
jgi:hypothetical protein